MTNLTDLTTGQLHRILAIKEQIERLQAEIDSIASDGGNATPAAETPPKRRHMSASARARIAAAARARWARIKGTAPSAPKPPKKGKRRLSAAGRAAIIAATKARWAREKGATVAEKPAKKRRKVSAAVKAKLAAIAKARWAKAKAEGKSAL
jgi:hypothetical protein